MRMSVPERPLRILHLIQSLRPGGAEQLLLTNVRHLARSRFESIVVTLFPRLDLKVELERCGAPVYCLGLRGRLDWWRGTMGLARLLCKYRIDILHTHLYYANVYGRIAAFLARVPSVVSTLHFCEYANQDMSRAIARLKRWVDRFTARRMTSLFIAVSTAVKEDYQCHLGIRNVEVSYNYVDVDEFVPPLIEVREEGRRALQLSNRDFVLINVARFHREKGQEYLIRAMSELALVMPFVKLLLVGEGSAEAYFRAVVREEGLAEAVVFVGQRRDIARVLAVSDIFVFPSVAEGLGIALLEAMAMGMPVVASRSEGIQEVVDHGVNGLLVEPCNPKGLARAVIQLYQDQALARSLGTEARNTVVDRFNAKIGGPRLEMLYARLAGQVPR